MDHVEMPFIDSMSVDDSEADVQLDAGTFSSQLGEPEILPLRGEDDDDNNVRDERRGRNRIPAKVYLFSMCAMLNSANLGYDMGVNTSASRSLQRSMELSDVELEIFIGGLAIFSMLGALLNSPVNDRFGRRVGFLVSNVFCIAGMGTDALARDYAELMIGKILVGVGVGLGLATNPLYIAELAPMEYRGYFVTWCDIGLNFGMVLGYVAGFVKIESEPDTAWRYMFALGIVLPITIILLVVYGVVESPRWLVQNNQTVDATLVLRQIYGADHDVGKEIQSIRRNITQELRVRDSVSWKSLICYPRPAMKRVLFVGLGIAILHDFIGIAAIQYYMTDIIEEAGLQRGNDMHITVILIILGSLKVLFGSLAAYLFDKRGRRMILTTSVLGCALSCALISVSMYNDLSYEYTVCGLLVYLCSYSFGMGPGAWVVASEIFPLTIRAKGMGLAIFLNRGTAALSASTFLTLTHFVGYAGFFLLTAVQSFATLLFVLVYVPETKGISLEDMAAYFAEVTRNPSFLDLMVGFSSDDERDVADGDSTPLLM